MHGRVPRQIYVVATACRYRPFSANFSLESMLWLIH